MAATNVALTPDATVEDLARYYEKITRPAHCSHCQATTDKIKLVCYGYPTGVLMKYAQQSDSRITLGGCCFDGNNKYFCTACNEYFS